MIFFIDENIPRHLAEGFHILQKYEGIKKGYEVEVKYLADEFHSGIKDEDWIPIVGKQKACVITQDINITKRKHELELYFKSNIGLFYLKGKSKKQGLSVWEMVEVLAKRWEEIVEKASLERRPFAFEFSLRGKLKRVR